MKCNKCGKELNHESNFCPFCGAKLDEPKEEKPKKSVKKTTKETSDSKKKKKEVSSEIAATKPAGSAASKYKKATKEKSSKETASKEVAKKEVASASSNAAKSSKSKPKKAAPKAASKISNKLNFLEEEETVLIEENSFEKLKLDEDIVVEKQATKASKPVNNTKAKNKSIDNFQSDSFDDCLYYVEPGSNNGFNNSRNVNTANEPVDDVPYEERGRKKGPGKTLWYVLAGLAVVGIVVLVLFIINKNDEIDLKEMTPKDVVIGYNGLGEAEKSFVIDEDDIDSYIDSLGNDKHSEDIRNLLESVEYTTAGDDMLSNGDIIKVTADYDTKLATELDVKIANTSFNYIVEDLETIDDAVFAMGEFENYPGDFVLPDSHTRVYTEVELYDKFYYDLTKVQRAINEIYARHGYAFKEDLFSGCEWYIPFYSESEFDKSWFTSAEKANLSILTQIKKELDELTCKCYYCGKTIIMDYTGWEVEGDYFCDDCYDKAYYKRIGQYYEDDDYDDYDDDDDDYDIDDN